MRLFARYAVPLLLTVAAVTLAIYATLAVAGRRWLERDLSQRAQLALLGAREAIEERWSRGEVAPLARLLDEIARDERVMAAAACTPSGVAFARSAEWRPRWCKEVALPSPPAAFAAHVVKLGGASAQVALLPVVHQGRALGLIAVAQDMAWMDRLEDLLRLAALWLFGVLAAVTSIALALMARASFARFARGILAALQGQPAPREFAPLLQDVRELYRELRAEAPSGAWTADRLRHTLQEQLDGERVIIVANREPYIHDLGPDGAVRVQHPASGLVTALEPVMRACSGVWVAHGSGSADRQVSDRHGRVRVPPGDEAYTLRRVWLSKQEEAGYYYGFANEGLWPLCHIAHARPQFRSGDFAEYERVNQRFAEAVCAEADREDPIVLVQDYHFALAPALIRARLPKATILTFWHIPWPNSERFGICPFREQLLRGLLGSSIVGFHIRQHCNNFLEACDRFLEARLDREEIGIVQNGRPTLVRPYPISIEWPNGWAETAPPAADCRAQALAELGLPEGARIGVGVDRLDYTKGLEERLLAVERLFERHPGWLGRFTFVQLAAPSRTAIGRYRELNESTEQLAARINARFGGPGWRPIALLRQHHEPPRVFRWLRAADLAFVSSLHDGMNLVAKEFVAARADERGALVLSQFTGAARELTEALIVNPYDLDGCADALDAALRMPPEEQAARLRSMRALVAERNVYRWAGRMLLDAATLRRRERLATRLSRPPGALEVG